MTDNIQSPYLTDVQVAKYLNISISTMRGWRFDKKGPVHTKIGHSIRYHIDDINAFIKKGIVEHVKDPIIVETA
jgi:predicted DNA-binding transcriptional regulator AlpA